jgi:hypothetical protein
VLSVYDAGARTRAAAAGARSLDRDVRKAIRASVSRELLPTMRASAMHHARKPLARAVAGTARLSWWKDVPGVAFGGRRAVASTGVDGRTVAHGVEYGSDGTRKATFRTTSPKGASYSVTRETSAQFRPRTADGAFVAAAAEEVAPDVVARWADLVVEATVDALGG